MPHNVPNLDAMPEGELRAFWGKYHLASRKVAVALVGEEVLPKAAVKVAAVLANYAINKACAVSLRLEGKIARAETYEHACDLHYENIPPTFVGKSSRSRIPPTSRLRLGPIMSASNPSHHVAFRVLSADHKGWARAWAIIEKKHGPVVTCPITGEQWQYLGSTLKGTSYVHEFRHRFLKGRRVFEAVLGQDDDFDWTPTRFSRVRLRTARPV